MTVQPSLTDPDKPALERSRLVTQMIRAAIVAAPGNVIGFDDFMEFALYAPEVGYYNAPHAIFGSHGDFITAPESGVLFGRCLARQVAEILATTNGNIVEYGAGSGRLALTLLEALRESHGHADLHYHIVEPSAALRARQRELLSANLPGWENTVSWSAQHSGTSFIGVVIANEVLDAMPARRYVVADGEVCELGVSIANDEFVWQARSDTDVPATLTASIETYADGYCCETLPALSGWLESLVQDLERGVVLLADYGYPRHEFLHSSRSAGTLKCHFQHQVHDDPFVLPGLQDITTAVNFTDVAELGDEAGFRLAGFSTQTRFLLNCGLHDVMAASSSGDIGEDYMLAQEAKRLLLPGEMGQTVKLMALAIDYDAPLIGFSSDERHRLEGFNSSAE